MVISVSVRTRVEPAPCSDKSELALKYKRKYELNEGRRFGGWLAGLFRFEPVRDLRRSESSISWESYS
jgi:hypothetical protein